MGFFKLKSKQAKSKPAEVSNGKPSAPVRVRWQSTWTSSEVAPDEIEELVHIVTAEMKLRAEALDSPFLLLPFRPSTDSSSARSFINTFFKTNASGSHQYRGSGLQQELRLTDPTVLCSILKWCWSRMSRGVVSWPVYEAFRFGEKEANMARNAFDKFIPLGADSPSRTHIIVDFFDLLAAIAAHGKLNGLGGRKLSRLAGWWAFEHSDGGKGFEGGYKSWTSAADACSHLFFAYLRSLSPNVEPSMNVIERIPRSLQALLASTEYPPEAPQLLQRTTPRVVMIVDQVSPTPFSLLRRAKGFEYRQNDRVLREYSEFDDPVDALTDECKRVLYAIAATNSSGPVHSRHGLAKSEETWTSFTSVGFGDLSNGGTSTTNVTTGARGVGATSRNGHTDIDRPTTPSWGDFLSSGFQNEVSKSPSTMLLPPDKVLPPIQSRTQTPSIRSGTDYEEELTPGELAAITSVELDDAFWWVWMTSLAGEEPNERKAVFGRCALIETSIQSGQWLIMEEQVKGASPDPLEGAQIVEKKSRFSFTRRGKRNKTSSKRSTTPSVPELPAKQTDPRANRLTLSLEQENKIREAAADLSRNNVSSDAQAVARRGRQDESATTKTQSTLTLGLRSEAGPAMKWANSYDKNAIRSAYLGSDLTGTGQTISTEDLLKANQSSDPSRNDSYSSARAQRVAPSEPVPTAQAPHPAPTPPAETTPPVARYDPLEKELGPAAPEIEDHPAYRDAERTTSPEPERNPAILAAKLALEGRAVSPESTKGNKLRKHQQDNASAGGFRKFFGRSKDKNNRRSTEVKQQQHNIGSTSAASDAALNRKLAVIQDQATQPTQIPPQEPVIHVQAPQHEEHPAHPTQVAAPQGYQNESTAALSAVDSQDQRDADAAFSRFDQGPVEDMPAAMPQESPNDSDDVAETPTIPRYSPGEAATTPYATPFEQPAHFAPPAQVAQEQRPAAREPVDADDTQSETTMDDHKDTTTSSPINTVDSSKDRWERIRENAARRAANARASEETSTKSRPTASTRTDDGETSGEETIESRVARIKARVAELTGNMDNGPAMRR